jgi:hypothetical protein
MPICGVAFMLALLNSRYARRRSRFNRASRCEVSKRHKAHGTGLKAEKSKVSLILTVSLMP